ncbi:crotonase/enoyl-CoA hydratase family protein [Frankia sp. CNm7]|uniref:Crotonase/enoyl-CoA hydratase family protein n=1 Tax=Frankia nepalensis TaxID=1836974 RepID=A0A937RSR8_9ACTN|nr:crotonase/enoyl-CoA hydratase family protein [Frankia nepalensis]MBL7497766.1 crotonase/enoyl-CoA hydratase family protein [Frankia nepalensis]MBL7512026.1 crotonase/enoyl-CoA hydratase family protein [Frankia nepalensis]MBL7520364.1 crotonase/enoyl-CoA hydratase family protein [Frankia nepalensis]MBL7632078.1 crotonase/enoyl-CoA hydratase family protein [Frankia nepalensis]
MDTTDPAARVPARGAGEEGALLELRGHVAVVTLNRPSALNAVNSALSTAAGAALERARSEPDVRVVVITGAGRAFCAGADLKEIARGHRVDAPEHPDWGFAGIAQHWVAKPTIAAVNGFALGGGTEIVLACDLAVIDETASLGLPEVRRGLFAAAGGVIRLQRQIPLKAALEIALTGEPVPAARALDLGLVNRVAPAGTALAVALGLAEKIAANAPLAVQTSKRIVHRTYAAGSDWDGDVWKINADGVREVFASRDAREGARAFAEKRQPRWEGR